MTNVLIVARKEFKDGLRSRWLLAITAVFAALALSIAYVGSAASGRVGFTSLATTLVSLTTLAGFVVPLISLVLAYDTLLGERDNGVLLLLLSYPLSRMQLLAGKFLGHNGVLTLATVLGFGGAIGVIELMSPAARTADAWRAIAVFIVTAALLGSSFVGIACLISAVLREKSRAAGIALLTWFVFVVAFDLLLLGILVVSRGNAVEQRVFPYLLMLNPIDVFRLINIEVMRNARGADVLTAMTGGHSYGSATLCLLLVVWSVLPFAVAMFWFRRQEV
jgi:Cu-processing system permease protein